MSSPWECVCEFIRSQSANLQNVMQSLSNQNTISDLDTSDTLTLNSGMNPLHMFMFLLLAVWGFLYVQGRRQPEAAKPQGPPSSPQGGSGAGSSGGAGAGSGSGPDSGELY
eukprot:CAMPEP_0203970240 /NCGR_PEP_ID=MMETSP0359-20131031/97865_1 /ASSEMBLY_ACC=CAM_ASM_000338 /TAXON_ID=268821 /ORGANISM="Scrippsiella Hangoei, Strain SHTV-5" /LENGTH=110 /DNA_ID=CAMNT_0050908191 /DNA_START=78 /DNA_END=410 /DNA_ORIENTATION=-